MSSTKSPSSSPSPNSSPHAGPCIKQCPCLNIKLLPLPSPHGPPKVSSPLLDEEGFYDQDAVVLASKIPKATYIDSDQEEVMPLVSEKNALPWHPLEPCHQEKAPLCQDHLQQ